MRVSLVFATFLCFGTWTSSIQSHGLPSSCCLRVSNIRIRREHIAGYIVQTRPECPINAIVFRTIRDKRFCSDPDNLWTKTTMEMLDGRSWHQSGPHRFHTKTGGMICSDQNSNCAKKDMLKIEEGRRKRLQRLRQLRQLRSRTKTGGTICFDRNGDCAKEDVLKVAEEDRKNTLQENGQNDEGAKSDITPATATTSAYTTRRENEQYDEGATSAVTPATATTSKLHHTEKPKVQWKNVLNIFCLRNHNTSPSYHSHQTSLLPVVLLLLYCISEQ